MDVHPSTGSYANPIPAQIVPPQQNRPRTSGFVKFLLFLLIAGLAASVLLNIALIGGAAMSGVDSENRVRERHFSHARWGSQKIAIIDVEGTILDGEGFFKRQIDHARREAEKGVLKAIVLRVNSPGGTVSGSDYMYHHLTRLREETGIPVVVSMGGIAASGGYYISMAVGDKPQTIYAEPTTFTGSIGVIIPHYDLSGLLEEVGVREDSITSHPLKGMGSLSRPMTPEERTIFKGLVDDGFDRFKEVIQTGRPNFAKDAAALDAVATGQVYAADEAKELGLVDEIGYLEDAVERAIELAAIDPEDTSVVRYKPELGLLDVLMGAQARQAGGFDLKALLDLSSPRAFYLCTRLPALLTTDRLK
ncbi:MAG: signal peptide peptidase SppA [Planctomycetota bacterium]